jgi:hypothetical protein
MSSKRRKFDTRDCLRPSARESNKTINSSRRLWHTLLTSSRSKNYFPQSCVNVNRLLQQTPSIPAGRIDEISQELSLSLSGFSRWQVDSINTCELSSEMKSSRLQKVVIGLRQPNFCAVSQDFLSTWVGFKSLHGIGLNGNNGNYIFALVLGWSYIFSTRLVELRKRTAEDKVAYTDEKATLIPTNGDRSEGVDFFFPIGDVDLAEARWWAAILARGCGWQSILCRGENS